nr:DUF3570 domain-containing protein [Pseudenhygromyxa sp. WMMC2535]
MVTFRKELPKQGVALEAEYLLDVISSASIASGALALGGDEVFTEMRHETSFRASGEFAEDWAASGFYRYSTETDYTSHNFGVGLSRQLLQRTATISVNYSASINHAFRITNNIGALSRWTSSRDTNLLQVHYLSLGYGHILHRNVIAGLNLEGIYAAGPQDNPYRRARNGDVEIHPWLRKRLAPSVWLRWSVPKAKMAVEPRYRYYADDWQVQAHAVEARVHFRPHRNLRLRLRYRFYTQTEAFFWRDDGVWAADYPWRSDDPKMDDFHSHTVGARLIWGLDGISKFKGLGWLAGAWIEATYNHVFVRCTDLSAVCLDQDFGYGTVRSTRYGDNRIGNLAFSLAF